MPRNPWYVSLLTEAPKHEADRCKATFDDTTHFHTFDPTFQITQNALQSPAQIENTNPPLIAQDSSGSMDIAAENENLDMMNLDTAQYEGQAGYTGGGQGSDDDRPTPELQAKRKAQNRAAYDTFSLSSTGKESDSSNKIP